MIFVGNIKIHVFEDSDYLVDLSIHDDMNNSSLEMSVSVPKEITDITEIRKAAVATAKALLDDTVRGNFS